MLTQMLINATLVLTTTVLHLQLLLRTIGCRTTAQPNLSSNKHHYILRKYLCRPFRSIYNFFVSIPLALLSLSVCVIRQIYYSSFSLAYQFTRKYICSTSLPRSRGKIGNNNTTIRLHGLLLSSTDCII